MTTEKAGECLSLEEKLKIKSEMAKMVREHINRIVLNEQQLWIQLHDYAVRTVNEKLQRERNRLKLERDKLVQEIRVLQDERDELKKFPNERRSVENRLKILRRKEKRIQRECRELEQRLTPEPEVQMTPEPEVPQMTPEGVPDGEPPSLEEFQVPDLFGDRE